VPDLLSHVFIAYMICTLLSLRVEWLDARFVTVVLVGALIPDLVKVHLLVDETLVTTVVGVPFSWQPLQLLGGVAISVVIGGLVVHPSKRKAVVVLLGLGAVTHLVADGLLLTPTGRTTAVFWPLTRWHPPTPGLYLSTQTWPTVITGGIAIGVWIFAKSRARCSDPS
jgi:hypothetical protein